MKQNFGRSEAMYFEGKWMFHFSVSSYCATDFPTILQQAEKELQEEGKND